jgi:hypothetical protein
LSQRAITEWHRPSASVTSVPSAAHSQVSSSVNIPVAANADAVDAQHSPTFTQMTREIDEGIAELEAMNARMRAFESRTVDDVLTLAYGRDVNEVRRDQALGIVSADVPPRSRFVSSDDDVGGFLSSDYEPVRSQYPNRKNKVYTDWFLQQYADTFPGGSSDALALGNRAVSWLRPEWKGYIPNNRGNPHIPPPSTPVFYGVNQSPWDVPDREVNKGDKTVYRTEYRLGNRRVKRGLDTLLPKEQKLEKRRLRRDGVYYGYKYDKNGRVEGINWDYWLKVFRRHYGPDVRLYPTNVFKHEYPHYPSKHPLHWCFTHDYRDFYWRWKRVRIGWISVPATDDEVQAYKDAGGVIWPYAPASRDRVMFPGR